MYSDTVMWLIEQLLAMARLLRSCSIRNRNISFIFRMDSFFAGIIPPQRCRFSEKVFYGLCFASVDYRSESAPSYRLSAFSFSGNLKKVDSFGRNQWTLSTGMSGQFPPELVATFNRNGWPVCSGIRIDPLFLYSLFYSIVKMFDKD